MDKYNSNVHDSKEGRGENIKREKKCTKRVNDDKTLPSKLDNRAGISACLRCVLCVQNVSRAHTCTATHKCTL